MERLQPSQQHWTPIAGLPVMGGGSKAYARVESGCRPFRLAFHDARRVLAVNQDISATR